MHLSYVREKTGHALIGARQWIPAEDIADPVKSLVTGLPLDLRFRTKGQLAIDVLADAYADGPVVRLRVRRRGLRQLHGAAGVPGGPRAGLRAAGRVVLHARARRRDQDDLRGRGEEAAEGQARSGRSAPPARGRRASAGTPGPGSAPPPRGTACWSAATSRTGELAFHYCYVPEGQAESKARLIRAAGLRWPVEESFELGKGCFGLDQCQARLYTAILRHARAGHGRPRGLRRHRRPAAGPHRHPGPPPAGPDDKPPADPGLIPLSVHEVKRLLAAALSRPEPPGHAARWLQLATPPPGTIPLVPQTRTPGTRAGSSFPQPPRRTQSALVVGVGERELGAVVGGAAGQLGAVAGDDLADPAGGERAEQVVAGDEEVAGGRPRPRRGEQLVRGGRGPWPGRRATRSSPGSARPGRRRW